MQRYHKYLDPRVLNKITKLDLKARLIVEGFVSGLHRSPYHGFSVEFAQHREYTPGDDLRHLDWKVFGRSDRLYVKEYEQETNLRATILLDTSESMAYSSGEVSKLEYGCQITAALAYLITQQQDAVGLGLFDRGVKKFIPPASSPMHMKGLLAELEAIKPEAKTDLGATLHALAERITRKGLIIIVSDLFDDPARILAGLQHFRHKKHEVIVFHVLDEYEATFPFERMTLFDGMEEYPKLLCDPRALRTAYLQELTTFQATLKRGCLQQRIDFVPLTTDRLLDVVLSTYLATRLGTRTKKA
ncbi:MAG: DUF58 domain-containing protein [Planctomycetes bacterium]|nr:DUF58 domain-containing protein [Planctomycetota bacterium]